MSQPVSDSPPFRYSASLAAQVEARWQAYWKQQATFAAPNPGEPGFDAGKPKKYVLDMFPYPSGVGLHVGHPLGYIATDIYARYLRMTGHNVLHAMGYDAFGLPAEQYAVQTNTHPRITTERNIATMRAQLARLGLAHDDRRSVATTDEGFYRWTQWIFLQLYNAWFDPAKNKARPIGDLMAELNAGTRKVPGHDKPWSQLPESVKRAEIDRHRLAYLAEVPVNWCPALGTVLANEEVIDGRSERGNHPVYRRPLKQWMMRITAYADRLLDDLALVDWPEPVKLMQRNWIGRSEGAYIDFPVSNRRIRVFTTRPDTIYGATFMVLAPDHPMVDALAPEKYGAGPTSPAVRAVFPGAVELLARDAAPRELIAAYRAHIASKAGAEPDANAPKTGVFTGAFAINPVNQARIPILIADYVLMGYGTGAIMAVPAHDERDHAFAQSFGVPIVRVVQPPAGAEPADPSACFSGEGTAVNSPFIDGLPTTEAKKIITEHIERNVWGRRAVQYKLRDWLFSRQRYWGEPFPIVFDDDGVPHALPEAMLPVRLPEIQNFQPEASTDPDAPPRPPLARATEWMSVTLDLGDGRGPRRFTREANTMPNWAGSCWYYLRYLDPDNDAALVGKEAEKYWMAGLGTPALRAGSSFGLSNLKVAQIPAAVNLRVGSFNRILPVGADILSARQPSLRGADFEGRDPYPAEVFGPVSSLVSSRRSLPHLEMPGATYFVTWSTRDGRNLTDAEKTIVLKAMTYFDGKKCQVYAACVMSNHVHWLVRPYNGQTLKEIVASVRRFSAREVNRGAGDEGSLWLYDSFDHIVRDSNYFDEFVKYIVNNPLEAKVAALQSDYPWTFLSPAVTAKNGQPIVSGTPDWADELAEQMQTRASAEGIEEPARRAGVPNTPAGGVDLYVGGVEHAVLHLLYARFWHKALFDLGHVSTPEPFAKLFNQGYIQAAAYTDVRGAYVPAEEVTEVPERQIEIDRITLSSGEVEPVMRATTFEHNGQPVFREFGKMGKSLKNAVAPDEVCAEYGCDTLRIYEMSMGPLEASKPWNTRDIAGAYRFLQRLWRNLVDEATGNCRAADMPCPPALRRALHKTIEAVRRDMQSLGFNTAVARLIEFNNELTKACADGAPVPREAAEALALLLAPLAPHMAEELWSRLGHAGSLAYHPFPQADPAMLVDDTVEIPVQVLGKLRGVISVPAGSDAKAVEAAAVADPKIRACIEGKTIRKVIVVPGKMINFVVA